MVQKSIILHPNTYSDVITTCTLDFDSVTGEDATDTATNMNGTYVFDELAIYSGNNDLLTHVIFPIRAKKCQ